MAEKKIRAVIVGTAHMHCNEIAKYLSEESRSELVAVADTPRIYPETSDKRYTRNWNLKNISEHYAPKSYADYQEMLEKEKPDIAYLLCENSQKRKIAEEIAKRGINVVIEKPMTVTAEDAKAICDMKQKYGVQILVNWPVAWRPYLYEQKAALDSGKYGKLLKLRYLNGHTGPLGRGVKHRGVSEQAEEMTDQERSNTWWYHTDTGGGAYLDILCYGCYFARWLFGRMPEDIFASGWNLNTPIGDAEDNIVATMNYGNAFAIAEGTWTTPRRRIPAGPELICTDGVIWCDGSADTGAFISACDILGNDTELNVQKPKVYPNLPTFYADYVEGKCKIPEMLTTEFNYDVIRMIDAAVRSGKEKKASKPQ